MYLFIHPRQAFQNGRLIIILSGDSKVRHKISQRLGILYGIQFEAARHEAKKKLVLPKGKLFGKAQVRIEIGIRFLSCDSTRGRVAPALSLAHDHFPSALGGCLPYFASYSAANLASSLGSQRKHCDFGRSCSLHQSPFC
jgi:hypothetical protein